MKVRDALQAFEGPDFRWSQKLLRLRAASYRNLADPRADHAEREFQRFLDNLGPQLPAVAAATER